MTKPKFCIYGAGSVGGMMATLLATAGADVSVVARGATLAALRKDGLRLTMGGRDLHALVHATDDPAALGPQDYVIIAVKEPSLPAVAAAIGPLLGPETAVVTAMNGVPWWFFSGATGPLAGQTLSTLDPAGLISRAIPDDRAIGCVMQLAATLIAPGVIRHNGGRKLIIGEPHVKWSHRLETLSQWFERAGFECAVTDDIRSAIWFKLLGNLSLNPISLLTTSTTDKIMNDPLLHKLCVNMMEEAIRIGQALGLKQLGTPEQIIDIARGFGPFKTSMLQDLERGSMVEIDALLTVLHDIGLMVSIPTPFIDSVLGLARLRAEELGLFEQAA